MNRKKIFSVGMASILAACCLFSGNPVTADTMSDLESRQSELEQEKKDVEAMLSQYENEAEETDKYLEEYDNKMQIQEEQVDNIARQIAILQSNIDSLEESVSEKEEDVNENIDRFGQRLRALYMSGNDSMASVLAGSNSFYDMLARMEFVERISKHDNDLIDSLHEQIADLESEKAELESELAALEEKKAQEEQYYDELRETWNNHAETKKMQQARIDDYKEHADEIKEEQQQVEEELQAEIRRLQEEAERKRKEEEERRKQEEELKKQQAEENGTEYVAPEPVQTYSDTGFIWPVPTVRNMTDGYGERWIVETQSSDFHKGIDINKPGCAGEPVVASAGGTVIQAGNKYNGYGNCVIIDHGNGISTLYAHNNSVAVSVGDTVVQGQTIAYIGHTGQAFGDHCHFEVRIDGQHTNPLNYVSMDN